jgi:hypothetical protein
VCCAAALLETRHLMALTEVAPLLADPEPNARSGVASVLGTVGGEGCREHGRVVRTPLVVHGDPSGRQTNGCVLRSSSSQAVGRPPKRWSFETYGDCEAGHR